MCISTFHLVCLIKTFPLCLSLKNCNKVKIAWKNIQTETTKVLRGFLSFLSNNILPALSGMPFSHILPTILPPELARDYCDCFLPRLTHMGREGKNQASAESLIILLSSSTAATKSLLWTSTPPSLFHLAHLLPLFVTENLEHLLLASPYLLSFSTEIPSTLPSAFKRLLLSIHLGARSFHSQFMFNRPSLPKPLFFVF